MLRSRIRPLCTCVLEYLVKPGAKLIQKVLAVTGRGSGVNTAYDDSARPHLTWGDVGIYRLALQHHGVELLNPLRGQPQVKALGDLSGNHLTCRQYVFEVLGLVLLCGRQLEVALYLSQGLVLGEGVTFDLGASKSAFDHIELMQLLGERWRQGNVGYVVTLS